MSNGPGQPVTPDHILQVGLGFWASKTLLSAVEMELFTEVARRPGTLADLQGRLGLHPRSARDFLDALVALGFLARKDGVYANTAATDLFPDKRKPSYVGAYDALPNGGAFIVYDSIIDDDRSSNAFALLMSLNMLIETAAGFDYTARQCIGWMKEAGFSKAHAERLVGPDSMVIAIK